MFPTTFDQNTPLATCADESEYPDQWDRLELSLPMIEGGGRTLYDVSGNGNHGTFQPALPNGPMWADGLAGSAVSFDGVDDYADVGSALAFTDRLSICAWIRRASDTADQGVMQKGTASFGMYELHCRSAAGGSFMRCILNNDVGNLAQSTTPIAVGQWYYVAATWDKASGEMAVWVNGKKEGTDIFGSSLTVQATAFRVGQYFNSFHFHGQIMDGRAYSIALDASAIETQFLLGPNSHLTPRRRRRSRFASSTSVRRQRVGIRTGGAL